MTDQRGADYFFTAPVRFLRVLSRPPIWPSLYAILDLMISDYYGDTWENWDEGTGFIQGIWIITSAFGAGAAGGCAALIDHLSGRYFAQIWASSVMVGVASGFWIAAGVLQRARVISKKERRPCRPDRGGVRFTILATVVIAVIGGALAATLSHSHA